MCYTLKEQLVYATTVGTYLRRLPRLFPRYWILRVPCYSMITSTSYEIIYMSQFCMPLKLPRLLQYFVTWLIILRWGVLRSTPCRLSTTAYSIHLQLPSISGDRLSNRNLRTRHTVVTGTHLSWVCFYKTVYQIIHGMNNIKFHFLPRFVSIAKIDPLIVFRKTIVCKHRATHVCCEKNTQRFFKCHTL
jgi:hypothetical protein